jgi:hypothetical protein
VLLQPYLCSTLNACVSSVACLALPYFSTLSLERLEFRKNIFEHKMYVLGLPTNLSGTFLSLSNFKRFHKRAFVFVCSTRYSCQYLINMKFLHRFSVSQMSNFMKIHNNTLFMFFDIANMRRISVRFEIANPANSSFRPSYYTTRTKRIGYPLL